MSKVKNFDKKQKLNFRGWVSSKQKLNFVGHLILLLDIYDAKGNHSRQIGEATNSNVKKRFEILFDQAYLNAVYKHFSQVGTPILDSKNANVSELINKVRIVEWNIRYYKEDFESGEGYNIKVVNKNKKRFTQILRDGEVVEETRYSKIKKDELDDLIEERTGNKIMSKYEEEKINKNYFKPPRKNKRYLE